MSVTHLRNQARILDPEHGKVPIGTVMAELSGKVTFAVEFRTYDNEPWAIKVGGFATPELAWDFLDDLAAKPSYTGVQLQVTEYHRIPVRDPRGDQARAATDTASTAGATTPAPATASTPPKASETGSGCSNGAPQQHDRHKHPRSAP